MSWFCDSPAALKHKRNCKKNPDECGKCIWIDESASAMGNYGTIVEKAPDPKDEHPLLGHIMDKFGGIKV